MARARASFASRALVRIGLALGLTAGLVASGAGPAAADPGDITTVAGNGSSSFFDGAAVGATGVGQLGGVAGNERNGAYVTSPELHRVLEFDSSSGVVNLVAGDGTTGSSGDGGLAQLAQLNAPTGIVYDRAGGALIVADSGNHRLRRILLGGTRAISTIAGSGSAGFGGDGGPATASTLSNPTGIARAADGTIYVADTGNHRVRAISTLGTITTVAGTGAPGFGGDGGPATAAQLDSPRAVAVGGDGTIYIADAGNRRVRAVTGSGAITTVVGTGVAGSSGDGGPATAATLDDPIALLVDAVGTLWVGDRAGAVVRSVQAGVISRRAGVVGSSCLSPNGDGGAGAAASLCEVAALGARSNGDLLVAEAGSGRRLRAVSRVVPGLSGPVQSLVLTGGVGSLTVSWNAPADSGGAPVLDYRVQVLVGGSTVVQTVTGTSATVSGLSAGVNYVVSVWPRTLAGLGTETQGVGTPTADSPTTTAPPTTTPSGSTLPPPTTGAPVPVGGQPGGGSGGSGGTAAPTIDGAVPTGSESWLTFGLGVVALGIGIALVRVASGARRTTGRGPWG